jgi:hypothetical protein
MAQARRTGKHVGTPALRSIITDCDAQCLLLPDQHEQPIAPRDPPVDAVSPRGVPLQFKSHTEVILRGKDSLVRAFLSRIMPVGRTMGARFLIHVMQMRPQEHKGLLLEYPTL